MASLVGTPSPGIPATVNAAGDVIWKNEGGVGEVVDPKTGEVLAPGKSIVQAAGAGTPVSSAGDRTDEITATATLAALKADGTDGDGFFAGGAFTAGQFVVLADYAVAQYDGAAWQAGVA